MKVVEFKGLLLFVGACLLVSCSMLSSPSGNFSRASQSYLQSLRWMDFPGAARYMSAQNRDNFIQQFLSLEGLHVVDARLESVVYEDDETRAGTRMVLEYYLLPSVTVKTFRVFQGWSYERKDPYSSGTWKITTPFPPFP